MVTGRYMWVAPTIVLSEEERALLTRSASGRTAAVGVSQRAKVVLLAADGRQTKAIAQALAVAPATADLGKVVELQVLAGLERTFRLRLCPPLLWPCLSVKVGQGSWVS